MIEKKTLKVYSVNNSPFWEETQSFIFFCQLTVNETVFFCRFLQMLSTAATIEVSDVYLQCSVPCHVNSLARTVFENICFPFYLHKLTSIFRQSWSCEEIPKLSQVHRTVTIAAAFSSEWSINMPAKAKKDNTFSARQRHRKIKLINTRKAYKRQYVLRNLSRTK